MKLIEGRRQMVTNDEVNEAFWFDERVRGPEGPLYVVQRFVQDTVDVSPMILTLGAVNDGKGCIVISPSTYDFPWFTLVMNTFNADGCHKEKFNAWQLEFDKFGKMKAKALVDDNISTLIIQERNLLQTAGFRLPIYSRIPNDTEDGLAPTENRVSHGKKNNEKKKDPLGRGRPKGGLVKKSCPKVKTRETVAPKNNEDLLDKNDSLYDIKLTKLRIKDSFGEIRKLTRRLRLNAGMTKERRMMISSMLDRLRTKLGEYDKLAEYDGDGERDDDDAPSADAPSAPET